MENQSNVKLHPQNPTPGFEETGKPHQVLFYPATLNSNTVRLVKDFAEALAEKLALAEQKYGYTDGWMEADWMDKCRGKLREHMEKGDPRDVAAYCAFLWFHNEPTTKRAPESNPATTHPYGTFGDVL
jgi:hypothetical protein